MFVGFEAPEYVLPVRLYCLLESELWIVPGQMYIRSLQPYQHDRIDRRLVAFHRISIKINNQ